LSAWQAGLQLGLGGFLIGGSYTDAGRSAYPHQSVATGRLYPDDQFTWTAGASYESGPITVGVNYQHGHDAGDLTVAGARTADLYAVGVTYRLAPGLNTALEYLRSTTRNEPGFSRDALGFNSAASGNANLVLWRTQVTF
jgi:predicted porin